MNKHMLVTTLGLSMVSSISIAGPLGTFSAGQEQTNSYVIDTADNQKVRVTFLDEHIVRIQAIESATSFQPDRYETIDPERVWSPSVVVQDSTSEVVLQKDNSGSSIQVNISKSPVRFQFLDPQGAPFLQDDGGIEWGNSQVQIDFLPQTNEHFVGLGHDLYGRLGGEMDLAQRTVDRNYGFGEQDQSPLIVPFYLSNKGYGVFINNLNDNSFNFGQNGEYRHSFDTPPDYDGLDYFVIYGPNPADILNDYTKITGRPRLPQEAMLGLALSDKGDPQNDGESWWRAEVAAHRDLGLPLDHVVNDNRWRIGAGSRCDSQFGWDSVRYPDPAGYQEWLAQQGLVITLDFNRCIAPRSPGWSDAFNIGGAANQTVHQNNHQGSAPDFTDPAIADWWWDIFVNDGLRPTQNFPGDALWIDEFDALGATPGDSIMNNGMRWAEARNGWFLTIAKVLGDGWATDIGESKRPFIWIRGGTSGAQRYATMWSGDIDSNYDEMRRQIRGLIAAGLSGYPFWGHDGGGFHTNRGFTSNLYRQWALAFASFTPYWRPHGNASGSRWPMRQDNSAAVVADAKVYGDIRYGMMPYIYTLAFEASRSGAPMARAMLLEYPEIEEAWTLDQQYMWGPSMLVAPNASDGGSVNVWFPQERWYNYWNDQIVSSTQGFTSVTAPLGRMPLFVKAGAIIPQTTPKLSTAFLDEADLQVHVWAGADGEFTLVEDDKVTELYQQGQFAETAMTYADQVSTLTIGATTGSYAGMPTQRQLSAHLHAFSLPQCFEVIIDGQVQPTYDYEDDLATAKLGGKAWWNNAKRVTEIYLPATSISSEVQVRVLGDGCGPDVITFEHNLPQLNFRGVFGAWVPQPMTLVDNFIWEIEVSFDGTGSGGLPDRFKFDVTDDWSQNYGDDAPVDGIADVDGDDIIVTAGPGDYVIRFNDDTLAYTVTKKGGPQQFVSNFDNLFFRGSANSWDPAPMTLVADFTWQIDIFFDGQGSDGLPDRFKLDAVGDWSQNYGDDNADGIGDLDGDDILTDDGPGVYRITFNDQTLAYTLVNFDRDNDQLPNDWELDNNLDPQDPADAALDSDNDGWDNLKEFTEGTDPNNPDTDGDGMNDSVDPNPLVPDVVNPDRDNDGIPNDWEIEHGFDPDDPEDASLDGDHDTMDNLHEFQKGTDPNNPDTDGDNVNDNIDLFPLDVNEWEDTDNDGTGNNADTDDDNDNVLDDDDAFPLDPTEWLDTDGDGTGNNADLDDDNDGFSDQQELDAGTDPLDPNDFPIIIQPVGTRYDQNADGKADILWRSDVSGQNWFYGMNGHIIEQSKAINVVPEPWRMIGRGDFDGDGKGDLLWRNDDDGRNVMYLMDGNRVVSIKQVNVVDINSGWDIKSIGDFNGDGNDDMIWRNASTGVVWMYLMEGANIIASQPLTKISDSDWQIIDSPDLNGDGKSDVLLRHQTTGKVWLYLLNGNVISESRELMSANTDWQLVIAGDFDGDGDADILWRNTIDGRNYVYLLDAGVVNWSNRGLISQFTDQNWQAVMAGDFDGDGDDDIFWRHFGTGANYMYLMDGRSYSGKAVNTVSDLTWRPIK